MTEQAAKYITEVIKPWEHLNASLGKAYCIDPTINDFISAATSLAVSIKHQAELNGLIIKDLEQESEEYKIMSDVADASKHGSLRDNSRNNNLIVSSMFETNDAGQFRFLRNVININHNAVGKIDFIVCAKDAALYLLNKLDIKTNWNPKVYSYSAEFVDEVRLHASIENQVAWKGLSLQFVKQNSKGELQPFDPSLWKFHLTSEF
jgi:hypothetical protein